MFANFDLGVFLLAVLPVLLAITVREVARGYTARYWGDHTGEQFGRLTSIRCRTSTLSVRLSCRWCV